MNDHLRAVFFAVKFGLVQIDGPVVVRELDDVVQSTQIFVVVWVEFTLQRNRTETLGFENVKHVQDPNGRRVHVKVATQID